MVTQRALGLLLALSLVVPALTQAATLRFSPTSVSGLPNELVEVQVLVSTTDSIGGLKFTFDYDETVAVFEDINTTGAATEDFSMLINVNLPFAPSCPGTNKNALVQLFGGGTKEFTGTDQLVARLFFRLSSQPCGSTPLCWDLDGSHTQLVTARDFREIVNPELQLIDSNLANDCVQIRGNVHYYAPVQTSKARAIAAQAALPGVLVTATQDNNIFQETTNAAGDYDNLGPFNPTGSLPSEPGPVSVSASLTTVPVRDYPALTGHDLNLLLQHSASLANPPLTEDQLRAGNVTGGPSSSTGLADAVALAQFLAFIPPTASNDTGEWTFNYVRFVNGIAQADVAENLSFAVGTTSPEIVDVRGFILGDVDGNGPDLSAKPEVSSSVALSLELLDWSDDVITVSLSAVALPEPLETLLFSLEYDPAHVSYIDTERSDRAAGFFVLDNSTKDGVVHGVVASGAAPPAARAGRLLVFRFRQHASGASKGELSFGRLRVNDRRVVDSPTLVLSQEPVPDALPMRFALTVSPNPFNPSTRITFDVPQHAHSAAVRLRVYDIQGRLVARLAQGTHRPGSYTVSWDGSDERGRAVGSGLYFVHMQAGEWSTVQKISLLK